MLLLLLLSLLTSTPQVACQHQVIALFRRCSGAQPARRPRLSRALQPRLGPHTASVRTGTGHARRLLPHCGRRVRFNTSAALIDVISSCTVQASACLWRRSGSCSATSSTTGARRSIVGITHKPPSKPPALALTRSLNYHSAAHLHSSLCRQFGSDSDRSPVFLQVTHAQHQHLNR